MLVKNHQKGFTLIEISVALLIIGILISSGLYLNQANRTVNLEMKAQQTAESIQKALEVFIVVNGYLPCPDTDNLGNLDKLPADGRENRATNDGGIRCKADFGYLPYKDLGVEGLDAWGNPFAYKVNERVKVSPKNYINDICQPASIFAKTGPRVVPDGFERCNLNGEYYCNKKCAEVCGPFTNCAVVDPRQKDLPPYFHRATQPVGAEAYQNLAFEPSKPDAFKNLIVFKRDYNNGLLDEQPIENSVVAMVVSYGKNGKDTWKKCAPESGLTDVELENCNGSQKFVIDLPGQKDEYFSWVTLYRAKQIMLERGGFQSE